MNDEVVDIVKEATGDPSRESGQITLQQLRQRLCDLQISKVMSFDDDWALILGDSSSPKVTFTEMSLKEFLHTYDISIKEDEETEIYNEGVTTVQQLLDTENAVFDALRMQCREKLGISRREFLNLLKDTMTSVLEGTGIEFVPVAKQVSEDNMPADEGRILFLLDREIPGSDTPDDAVMEQVMCIQKCRPQIFDVMVVYTHLLPRDYTSHETKRKYAQDKREIIQRYFPGDHQAEDQMYLVPYQLWGLQKQTAEGELITALYQTLGDAAFGHSLHDYLELKLENANEVKRYLLQMSPDLYNSLYEDSFIEGEPFTDFLDRMHDSVGSKVLSDKFQDHAYLQTLRNVLQIADLKHQKLLHDNNGRKSTKWRQQIIQDRITRETYKEYHVFGVIDTNVNHVYSDIRTGDIFRFRLRDADVDSYGVLVTVDCDLVVRVLKNIGDPTDRNVSEGTVLLFQEPITLTTETASTVAQSSDEYTYPIPKGDGTFMALKPDLKNAIRLSMNLLDYCGMNSDGKANLSPSTQYKAYKTGHFNDYAANELFRWAEQVNTLEFYLPHELVTSTEESLATVAPPSVSQLGDKRQMNELTTQWLSALASLKYGVKYDSTAKTFDIERIGRLEARKSLRLVQQYNDDAGRVPTLKAPS